MFHYHYYILWAYVFAAAVVGPVVCVFSWLVVAHGVKRGRAYLRWLVPFALSNTVSAAGALTTVGLLLLHIGSPAYYEIMSVVYLASIFGMAMILYGIVQLWKVLKRLPLFQEASVAGGNDPRVWPPPPRSSVTTETQASGGEQ